VALQKTFAGIRFDDAAIVGLVSGEKGNRFLVGGSRTYLGFDL